MNKKLNKFLLFLEAKNIEDLRGRDFFSWVKKIRWLIWLYIVVMVATYLGDILFVLIMFFPDFEFFSFSESPREFLLKMTKIMLAAGGYFYGSWFEAQIGSLREKIIWSIPIFILAFHPIFFIIVEINFLDRSGIGIVINFLSEHNLFPPWVIK